MTSQTARTRAKQLAWIALVMELVVPLLPLYGPYDASGHFRSKIFAHVQEVCYRGHLLHPHCHYYPPAPVRYLLTVGVWVVVLGAALLLLYLGRTRLSGWLLIALGGTAFIRAVRVFDTAAKPGSKHTGLAIGLTCVMGLAEVAAGALALRSAAPAGPDRLHASSVHEA